MTTTTGNDLPGAVRASDADRDAVLADLSQHFQAGRLTAEEFDERSSKALTARTWGELRELMTDLPDLRHPARPDSTAETGPGGSWPAGIGPSSPARPGGPPLIGSVIGVAIVAVVLFTVTGGWGLFWLIPAPLIIARRVCGWHGQPGHAGRPTECGGRAGRAGPGPGLPASWPRRRPAGPRRGSHG